MRTDARNAGSGTIRTLSTLLAAGVGLVTCLGALELAGGSLKLILAIVLAGGVLAAALVLRRPREVLLFAWVISLTYNRQYFLARDMGAQAPYFIVSDLFLALLAGLWIFEIAVLKRPPRPRGARIWPWYLPFALVALASVSVAARPDWALTELVRVIKVGFILVYVRYNVGRTEWWVCLSGVGAAMIVQAVLGLMEIATGHSGIMWRFGTVVDAPAAFNADVFYGWRRATGTMNHPPVLACYLLLVIPVAIALGLTHPRPAPRRGFLVAGLMGLACLAATLSRWPWLLMSLQAFALLVVLAARGVIPLQRSLRILAVVGVAGVLLAFPFRDRIERRITGDLSASVKQRANGFNMAFAMIRDHNPLLGVGLNNYRVYMPQYMSYDPEVAWALKTEDIPVRMNLRFLSGPQNGFLFVLAETGILGLVALLIYLLGVFRIGIRAVTTSHGFAEAACVGLLIGLLGVLGQQAIDYSYWVDPVLYTFALFAGLLGNAGVLRSTGFPDDLPGPHRGGGPAWQ